MLHLLYVLRDRDKIYDTNFVQPTTSTASDEITMQVESTFMLSG